MDLTSLHLIKLYFLVISIAVIFLGILINLFEKYLPGFILKTFRCGKHAYKGNTSLPTIEFPKSSFKQFYKVGILCAILTYPFILSTYILGFNVPYFFSVILFYCSSGEEQVTNGEIIFLNEYFL